MNSKSELRRHFRSLRDAIPAQERAEAAQALARNVLNALPKHTRCVAGYAAMNSEISLMPAFEVLEANGVALCLPCITAHSAPLTFRAWKAGDALESGPHGCQQPPETAAEMMPEVVLAPLLAFTRDGARLGYGGGYYDRTIARFRASGVLKAAIGVGFAAQEAERLPTEAHDARLDSIVTEVARMAASR